MTSLSIPDPVAHRVLSTDGVTVTAHDYGGSGPDLVMAHATGFHGRYWDPIAARLAHDFRCISVDLRGHGDSTIPEGLSLDWSGMAQDLLAVIDDFEVQPGALGVGHSMGGASIIMAEQARPGSYGAAWLFEPILPPSTGWRQTDDENPLATIARRRREVFDSREAVRERYASRPPFAAVDPAALAAYVDYGFRDLEDGTVILKCRGEIEAQVFDKSANGAFEDLGQVATRITVAVSGDGGLPAAAGPAAVDALPHATLERYDDLTHFGPMEDPDRIARVIVAALKPHAAAQGG